MGNKTRRYGLALLVMELPGCIFESIASQNISATSHTKANNTLQKVKKVADVKDLQCAYWASSEATEHTQWDHQVGAVVIVSIPTSGATSLTKYM